MRRKYPLVRSHLNFQVIILSSHSLDLFILFILNFIHSMLQYFILLSSLQRTLRQSLHLALLLFQLIFGFFPRHFKFLNFKIDLKLFFLHFGLKIRNLSLFFHEFDFILNNGFVTNQTVSCASSQMSVFVAIFFCKIIKEYLLMKD